MASIHQSSAVWKSMPLESRTIISKKISSAKVSVFIIHPLCLYEVETFLAQTRIKEAFVGGDLTYM